MIDRRTLIISGVAGIVSATSLPNIVTAENYKKCIYVLDKNYKKIKYTYPLYKDLTDILEWYMFELNDDYTRSKITNKVAYYFLNKPQYDQIRVICSEDNNTLEVIDSNNLYVNIFYEDNGIEKHLEISYKE